MRIGTGFTAQIRDNYDTPIEAWKLIMNNLKTAPENIWCPFYNASSEENLKGFKKILNKKKIKLIHTQRDFFNFVPKKWDCIIDNPPYHNKEAIIKRCVLLKKPFALLLPQDTLERKYINELFGNDKKFKIIIPNERYNFIGYENKANVPFKSMWFTYNLDLVSNNQLIFEAPKKEI
jgi:hypothetical protein